MYSIVIMEGAAMAEPLKEINFKGGVIKFKIPSNWEEVYAENGKGIFMRTPQMQAHCV